MRGMDLPLERCDAGTLVHEITTEKVDSKPWPGRQDDDGNGSNGFSRSPAYKLQLPNPRLADNNSVIHFAAMKHLDWV